MSGISTALSSGVGEVGGYGYRPPFTAVQWQELEHQAMIYKYLVAGLPVPPDLVMPIRQSFDALSARFFQHPSLGYCSYYGKKFDPEPGRCRRTDGKKWRCSKDAHMDSKYCERHMHRGRNRSRKPVESQTTSQSSTVSHVTTQNTTGTGTLPTSISSGTFQNIPTAYSVVSPGTLSFGNNSTKLQLEPVSFDNKEYRYMTSGVEEYNFASGMSSNVDNPWRVNNVMPSEVSKVKNDNWLLGNSSTHAYESMIDNTKQRQQHSFFGNDIDQPGQLKQEQHSSMRSFFDEWPTSKESWSNLDDDASNKNAYSTTQLSISIPVAPPDFSSRDN